MTKLKTGRPPSYSDAQLLEAIEMVEDAGKTPSGANVKDVLCEHFNVPPGTNVQSLDNAVRTAMEDRDRQRRAQLIDALPEGSHATAEEIAASVQSAVLIHLGQEHARLSKRSEERLANLEFDLANRREQLRALQAERDMQADKIAVLKADRQELQDQLSEVTQENRNLHARLTELQEKLLTDFFGLVDEAVNKKVAQVETAAN